LAVRPECPMTYGSIVGVDKPVSRIGMGCMVESARIMIPHASVLFDQYFMRSGNLFDTGVVYHRDAVLGQWVANRGIRAQVVIMCKGAHTPFCDPENLTKQFYKSLDDLKTDYVDIYMMHRDNPDIPAGEFIDVLNEHKNAGRMRAFGGSNWSMERIDEANDYARRNGLTGFSAISNNLSLAELMDPVWEGACSSFGPEWREWFKRSGVPLIAWSSLGRRFIVDGDPNFRDSEELERCWFSDENFRRLDRAGELGRKYGAPAITIAMALVLSQPFEIFALFGPSTPFEMDISMRGLDIRLSPEELHWL